MLFTQAVHDHLLEFESEGRLNAEVKDAGGLSGAQNGMFIMFILLLSFFLACWGRFRGRKGPNDGRLASPTSAPWRRQCSACS